MEIFRNENVNHIKSVRLQEWLPAKTNGFLKNQTAASDSKYLASKWNSAEVLKFSKRH